ncbi:MAG: hypothetical protein L3V56_13565 [Candidatus Magnetoovum sp. WYHC-5]|nr:hypothetical protein [Candidatus Magnetoovum sp. WYHC-5]
MIKTCYIVLYVVVYISVLCSQAVPAFAEESQKWTGVDESVVEKVAMEHGRQAREPFINTDQGDLLLFVFLLAGAIGGFVAGYSWRKLIEEGKKSALKVVNGNTI